MYAKYLPTIISSHPIHQGDLKTHFRLPRLGLSSNALTATCDAYPIAKKTFRSHHSPLQPHSQQYKIPQIGPNALVEGLKGGARRFCPHINIRARRGREKQTLYQGPLMATTAGRPPMLPSTKGKRTARNGFRRRSSKEVGRAEYIAEEGEGWGWRLEGDAFFVRRGREA